MKLVRFIICIFLVAPLPTARASVTLGAAIDYARRGDDQLTDP